MYRYFFKRIFDILGAVVLIVLTAPVMVWAYFAIKKHLGSPVIFTQARPGKNGKIFKIYKFRSMSDARDESGNLLSDEIRLGEFGKRLRALSIDELPQLFNVLKGDMSFVGPRPERPIFYEQFAEYIDGFDERIKVVPGLTGLAQISGGYNLKPEEKVGYDIEYIENRSWWLDLKLIFKTVAVVFTHDGAK